MLVKCTASNQNWITKRVLLCLLMFLSLGSSEEQLVKKNEYSQDNISTISGYIVILFIFKTWNKVSNSSLQTLLAELRKSNSSLGHFFRHQQTAQVIMKETPKSFIFFSIVQRVFDKKLGVLGPSLPPHSEPLEWWAIVVLFGGLAIISGLILLLILCVRKMKDKRRRYSHTDI
jgi:hypothetical protein